MVSSIYMQTKFSTIASAVLRDHKKFQGFTDRSSLMRISASALLPGARRVANQKQQKAVDEKGPKRVYGIRSMLSLCLKDSGLLRE